MRKKLFMTNVFYLLLLYLFWGGCQSTQERTVEPGVAEELRGYIRVEKSSFQVNQPIQVSYWLTNISNVPVQEQVMDGSSDPNTPFETYSFNAIEEQNKKNPLELKEAGTPLTGALSLMPGEEKLFCQNTFETPKAGVYTLSFFLRWKNGKRIEFKPATITIQEAFVKTPLDKEMDQSIEGLASKDTKIKMAAKEKLVEKGAVAVPALIQLFKSENPSLRSDAMFTTIAIGRGAVPALIEGYNNKNQEIRMRCLYALGQIGDTRGFPVITDALTNDPVDEVRLTALRFINETLSNPIAIPLLIKALEDNAVLLRKEAIQALQGHTNLTFDFVPDASGIERKKSIDQWKDWWQGTGSSNFKNP